MYRPIALILLLSLWLAAETMLGGQIGGMTLTEDGSPYIITKDLVVQKNKSLTIKQGTILLFQAFTGLNVEGSLSVEGSAEKPVIFTSANEQQYNPKAQNLPNPFDWNGIFIASGSQTVKLSYFEISFTVYGLKCQNPNISVTQGRFRQNGQFHFTINEQIQLVAEGMPFNYRGGTKEDRERRQKEIVRKAVPIVSGVAGLLTGSGAALSFVEKSQAESDYAKADNQSEIDRLAKKKSTALTKGIVYSSATALLIPTSVITYLLGKSNEQKENQRDKKQPSMSLTPVFDGYSTGLSLQIQF